MHDCEFPRRSGVPAVAPARPAGATSAVGWSELRRLPWHAWACGLVAILPVLFMGREVALWTRNIPIWDEFDTVLDLLITLDSGATVREITGRLLEMNNDHRMLVSRLLFAAAYWIFGGVNFTILAVVGNLFLLGAVGVLLAQATAGLPRLRLAAILGAMVFQLQHHENFFWGGSSIDHFFVVLAAIATLAAISRPGRGWLALGCAGGFLATFSLVHGLLVWPVGAVVLAAGRRWRALGVWGAVAALVLMGFFADYAFNPGHHHPGLAELLRVGHFWLTLVGSSPAFEDAGVAPWLGGALLMVAVVAWRRGVRAGEGVAAVAICWCLGALAMIAYGRALLSDTWAPITSRYVILSSLVWALLGWVLLERALARWGRPAVWLGPLLAGLVLFNLAANATHSADGRVFALRSERAVEAYHRHGTFGAAETPLYPDPARADALVREVARRGIYRLPAPDDLRLGETAPFRLQHAEEIGDAAYFIEVVDNQPTGVRVRGWAFRPDHRTRLGDVSVVFSAPEGLIAVEATPQMRPDVAAAHARHDVNYAGFEIRLPREKLPKGELRIGICFDLDGACEYMLTSSTLAMAGQ